MRLFVLSGFFALIALVVAPACGSGCPSGQSQVCNANLSDCVCAVACATYKDCDAADPGSSLVCDVGSSLCVPASFVQTMCNGQACNGYCDQGTGECDQICRHSSECSTQCCSTLPGGPDPACVPSNTGGCTQ